MRQMAKKQKMAAKIRKPNERNKKLEFDKTTQDALKLIHEGNHIIFREVGRVCEKYHLNYFFRQRKSYRCCA